ncbi:hypothetical protein AAHC03_09641 [Spirometra sp. Aus1]
MKCCNPGGAWQQIRIFLAEAFAAGFVLFPCYLLQPSDQNAPLYAAIAIGCSVFCAIWIVFPVSGAQINPMITLAVLITRRINLLQALLYWSAQFTGSMIGLVLGKYLTPSTSIDTELFGMSLPAPGVNNYQATVVELLATFTLVISVLASLDEHRPQGWRLEAGMALATTVMVLFFVNILITAPVSGASLNPFRSLGAAALQGSFYRQWIYIVGPTTGSLLAAVFYETCLSSDASWKHTRAWLGRKDFNRNEAYAEECEI